MLACPTQLSVFLAGDKLDEISVQAKDCPDSGCTTDPEVVVEVRDGSLLWSDAATWASRWAGQTGPGKDLYGRGEGGLGKRLGWENRKAGQTGPGKDRIKASLLSHTTPCLSL